MTSRSKSRLHIGRDVLLMSLHVCLFMTTLSGMFGYASLFFFCCAGHFIGCCVSSDGSPANRSLDSFNGESACYDRET